jgi:hypothetical protein
MILILRGHIRTSFETNDLLIFIKLIYALYPELTIYIHTWNIFSNNISWRKLKVNTQIVTEEIINTYFYDLKHLIKHIIIDDDSNIELIGNTTGNINNGPMPIIGWKNYWYGKYNIINYIYNTNISSNELIINCRFDVLNNSNTFNKEHLIKFITNNNKQNITKNIFLFDHECTGIDNFYLGNKNTLYKLSKMFFYNLDDILSKNTDTINQERLVFRLNNTIN